MLSRPSEAPAQTGRSAPSHPPSHRRFRKFLTYYRPHLPMLAADLGCAMLVAGTALALPVCASWIMRRLSEGLPGDFWPHSFLIEDACVTNAKSIWIAKYAYL